ncbi:flagellar protein FliS [Mariniblastus sp.]|jgi:flagellar secretion chaperone FliS|nr:flagellar protein FliS [Mariniblastus sp.]MDB2526279.1 flagellar protein FliS [Mariniblastus sp.]MDB4371391.1 flagellar protein FliS [Mariniblastus sp.]MDC3256288.1 flagellar protein FliS [bacterium]|eukprot:COSAG01_NODE_79_length_28055_cov_139.091894_9_plen_137_part_00
MAYQSDQVLDNMIKGLSRIDMLLVLYDRAIASLEAAKSAKEASDEKMQQKFGYEANKLIMGIHSGLDTEKYPVAVDVARLLHFIMTRIEQQDFSDAIKFTKQLRESYAQIRDQAVQLESNGEIPPIIQTSGVNTIA